ncbi:hypothetical protein HU200_002194 [Digitaria exilis]|uniref:Glutaredoxin-like protein n=1 Tax=Digitaria exilis TaxID=1010633 RepID=A0A835G043_9POAL|nr:hypothetical protein HU200_002194 [Digitaria exilis]
MAAALYALPRAASRLALRGRQPPSRALCAAAAAGEGSTRRLVLYTKPGCCLCDGLKEKLHAASLLAGTPYSLASLELQERDITTNPEWERLYQYEIPVLAKVLPDGTEEILPRLSPRLSVELVQKKIYSAFDQ